MKPRHIPNAITLARIGMALPLWYLLHRQEYLPALALALVAGLSDALDGAIAKRYGWVSRLGGLLDPIADKLLLAAGFVGLWSAGAVPGWLLALVLARDAVILAGALAWQAFIGPLQARPTRLSKATTAAQIAFLLLTLCGLALHWPVASLSGPLLWATAALTIASGLDYVLRWSARAVAHGRRTRA